MNTCVVYVHDNLRSRRSAFTTHGDQRSDNENEPTGPNRSLQSTLHAIQAQQRRPLCYSNPGRCARSRHKPEWQQQQSRRRWKHRFSEGNPSNIDQSNGTSAYLCDLLGNYLQPLGRKVVMAAYRGSSAQNVKKHVPSILAFTRC